MRLILAFAPSDVLDACAFYRSGKIAGQVASRIEFYGDRPCKTELDGVAGSRKEIGYCINLHGAEGTRSCVAYLLS